MITVACVNVNNYLGHGEEYVGKLRSMVARLLKQRHTFYCLRDGEGRIGWWAKTLLFKPDLFTGRVLYLDLDSVITGPLDELVEHKGIIDLRQWGWKTPTYGSGVMVWDGGEHAGIYERYNQTVPLVHRGDQDFITALGGWDALPDRLTRSYRYHCKAGPPSGCAVTCFHGQPKPHELPPGHWALEHWK